jgi:hypothetical protein
MLPTSHDRAFFRKWTLQLDELWRLQVACSSVLSRYKVAFAVFGSSSWLIDVTDAYVVSIGVHLALTHPCYASSGSLIHSSVPRGSM